MSCRCHSSAIYARLYECPKCGHRSLDRVGDWEGCERRKCGYQSAPASPVQEYVAGTRADVREMEARMDGLDQFGTLR